MTSQSAFGSLSATSVEEVPVSTDAQWPKMIFRLVFGVIWLVDAILKWLPGFRAGYMDTLMGQAQDQPTWLQPWFNFWINLQHPAATFFAYFVAVAETAIALSLILGFARKLIYSAAIVLSLLIWSTAEGFGGPYTAGSADVGTAIVYALVFALLLTASYYQGASRFSVDYWLEKRFPWWYAVAEIAHHRRPLTTSESAAAVIAASQPVAPQSAAMDPAQLFSHHR